MSTKFQNRNRRGAKLSALQVLDIRELYRRGDCTQGDLARDFQISIVQIGRIVRGEVWQSLPDLPSEKEQQDILRNLLKVQEETAGMAKLQQEGTKILGPGQQAMKDLEEKE